MTMPGPEFATPGTKGGGQTVAVNDRPQIETVDVSQSGSVTSGTTETVEIYAPSKATYSVRSMFVLAQADADATSGDHAFRFRPVNDHTAIEGKSDYNGRLGWDLGHFVSANLSVHPSNEAAQVLTAQKLQATESAPLVVEYANNTDAAQENSRTYNFVFERRDY